MIKYVVNNKFVKLLKNVIIVLQLFFFNRISNSAVLFADRIWIRFFNILFKPKKEIKTAMRALKEVS